MIDLPPRFVKGPTRRRLFVGLGALVALGTLGGLSLIVHTRKSLIVQRLHTLLPTMEIDDAQLDAYASDFIAHDLETRNIEILGLRAAAPLLYSPALRWMMPARARQLLESYDRRIITGFLLSTDFLEVRARGERRVSCVGFFEPYATPCGNPLPRLFAQT